MSEYIKQNKENIMLEEDIQNIRNNPEKAECYFGKKLAFTLGPIELKNVCEEKHVKLIDVRMRADYEIAHIPEAVSIPYEELADKMHELNKDELHIVYCYNHYCHLGAKAAYLLAKNGFEVMELSGGFKTWAEDFRFATT